MPYAAALPSKSSDAQWNTPPPGRMTTSTPAKPVANAASRAGVVRSPSMGQASKATTSGAVKLTAAASATGTKAMAVKKHRLEANSTAERRSCMRGRRVRNSARPWRGKNAATKNATCPKARAHATCTEA